MQRAISVLWPSFLMAGIATVLFFMEFDPLDLGIDVGTGSPERLRLTAYSVGFFLFWALTASSCLLTCYFQKPCGPKRSDDDARPSPL